MNQQRTQRSRIVATANRATVGAGLRKPVDSTFVSAAID